MGMAIIKARAIPTDMIVPWPRVSAKAVALAMYGPWRRAKPQPWSIGTAMAIAIGIDIIVGVGKTRNTATVY